jgi:DNA-binding transcriptional MerR regulator
MEKSPDAYRTISAVAEELDLPQHVLRFWETKFIQIRPLKRSGGRRFYRPEDVNLLRTIRQLLYGEGYTIKGVQRILKEQGARAVVAAMQGGGGLGALLSADAAQRIAEADSEEGSILGIEDTAAEEAVDSAFSVAEPEVVAIAAQPAPSGRVGKDIHDELTRLLAEVEECRTILEAARLRRSPATSPG